MLLIPTGNKSVNLFLFLRYSRIKIFDAQFDDTVISAWLNVREFDKVYWIFRCEFARLSIALIYRTRAIVIIHSFSILKLPTSKKCKRKIWSCSRTVMRFRCNFRFDFHVDTLLVTCILITSCVTKAWDAFKNDDIIHTMRSSALNFFLKFLIIFIVFIALPFLRQSIAYFSLTASSNYK